jgi:hypothetical protein
VISLSRILRSLCRALVAGNSALEMKESMYLEWEPQIGPEARYFAEGRMANALCKAE